MARTTDEDDPDEVLDGSRSRSAVGLWKSPTAKGRHTRNSAPLTTQLAVPAMAPELMAAGASRPWRWKKRTRTPKTAASPPTNDVKRLDVSRATQRPKGSGPMTAPVRAQAPVTTGSWPRTKAAATHDRARRG